MKLHYLNIILFLFFTQACTFAKHEKEITQVDIHFRPSFINSSALTINRKLKTVNFSISSSKYFQYNNFNLSLPLEKFETNTEIEQFYTYKYLNSIRKDTTLDIVHDGISLLVHYSYNNKMDSIYTGNVLSTELEQNLLQQIIFLKAQTNDTAAKDYLGLLSRYFN